MEIRERRMVLRPVLGELAHRCREAVGFGRIRDRRVVLEECVGPPGTAHRGLVGVNLPVYASALGKALLAHGWHDSRGLGIGCPRLVRHTRNTIHTRDALFDSLEEVRAQGFAFEDEELRVGVRALCVPVWGDGATPLGGLVIEGPSWHFDQKRMAAELIPLAMEGAARLGELLGSRGTEVSSRVA